MIDYMKAFPRQMSVGEISGSLGDLGTLLPLLLSLSITGQVSLTSSLVFGGLFNIITGVLFNIPVCVQPMKAIASVALAQQLTKGEVTAAGLSVGAILLFLGLTGLVKVVGAYTPDAVVRGIQLGTGFLLCTTAATSIKELAFFGPKWQWWDNYELLIVMLLLVYASMHHPKRGTALIMALFGFLLALINAVFIKGTKIQFVPSFVINVPTEKEWVRGFLKAGLGQVPLTVLNSVVAVCALAKDLYPNDAVVLESAPLVPNKKKKGLIEMSEIHMAVMIGIMNGVGCWFGSIPYCHGSGGLAGQHWFGARTGLSVVLLGLGKMVVGLVGGAGLTVLLNWWPKSVLAVMLFVSGVELATAAGKVKPMQVNSDEDTTAAQKDAWTVCMVTAGALVGTKDTTSGFLIGVLVYVLLRTDAKYRSSL